MNHELEDVEGLLREQAKRIEALEAALERSITRGSDAVERIATLEAALHKIDDTSIDHVAVGIARAALAPERDK